MDIQATNFIVEPTDISGDQLVLSETESHHLVKVMRARAGELFWAIDGQGNRYQAQIVESNPRRVLAKILQRSRMDNEPKCKITLACGLCRSAKVDFIVEKGTELGVAEFSFFISEKTYAEEISLKTAATKIGRWNKLAQSAAKQSLRTMIPKINGIAKYEDILATGKDHELAVMAEIGAESGLRLGKDDANIKSAILLIGPESGLSLDEIEKAHQSGFRPFGLGPRRLRAETAAIVFMSVVMSQLGEL
jgi:16S rRNA (uracil1498-N3)-methyltransferase